jgi:hypothetical protein
MWMRFVWNSPRRRASLCPAEGFSPTARAFILNLPQPHGGIEHGSRQMQRMNTEARLDDDIRPDLWRISKIESTAKRSCHHSSAADAESAMSLLHKGEVTAAAQRSQQRIPLRVTHPRAAPDIHHSSFSGFSAPPASRRCVFAAKSKPSLLQKGHVTKQRSGRSKRLMEISASPASRRCVFAVESNMAKHTAPNPCYNRTKAHSCPTNANDPRTKHRYRHSSR